MNTYKRHRFPPDVISYAVWLYYMFNLSHRDIEDFLAERVIAVSREAIRLWYPKHSLRSWGGLCIKFAAIYSLRLKRKHQGNGDTFFIHEVFAGVPDHSNQWQAELQGSKGKCVRRVEQGGCVTYRDWVSMESTT